MKFGRMLAAGAALSMTLAGAASATDLSGLMTSDNLFYAWLGTSSTSLGTLVGSGASWPTAFPIGPATLTAGQTNYLNIEAINGGGPGGLDFSLSLSDTGFQFANGSQTLTSGDLADYTATFNNNGCCGVQPWVAATGPAVVAGYPWGPVAGSYVWGDAVGGLNECGVCTVDFTVARSEE